MSGLPIEATDYDGVCDAVDGFFCLFYFVPIAGGLVTFVSTLLPSEADDNIHAPPLHRPVGGPRKPGSGPRPHDPVQGHAVLDRVEAEPTPDMIAARGAELRALCEQRVLGKGPTATG